MLILACILLLLFLPWHCELSIKIVLNRIIRFQGVSAQTYTYVRDVAIESVADVHLAHGDEQEPPTLHVAKVPRTQLQVSNFRHLDRLVADRFGDLLVDLQEAPEDGIGAHVWPIDYLLEISVQLCSPIVDLLVCLELEVGLGGQFR